MDDTQIFLGIESSCDDTAAAVDIEGVLGDQTATASLLGNTTGMNDSKAAAAQRQ